MGITAAVAAVAGAGTSIASAVEQKGQARSAKRTQALANQVEQARANIDRSVERRRAIANTRIAQASNIAGAEGFSLGSSALQGAQAGLGSDLGTSIASANRTFGAGQQAFGLRQAAEDKLANSRANAAIANAFSQSSFAVSGLANAATPQNPTAVN